MPSLGEPPDGPIYCDVCQFWLNGPAQWEDHTIGKKHKRRSARIRKQERATIALRQMGCVIAQKFLMEKTYRDDQLHIKAALCLARKVLRKASLAHAFFFWFELVRYRAQSTSILIGNNLHQSNM